MKFLSALIFSLVAMTMAARGYEPHHQRTEFQMQIVRTALELFDVDTGRYPTSSEGLAALIQCPAGISTNSWHGPYFDPPVQDAWRRDFVYVSPGIHNTNKFDLYSQGEDGVSKTGGNDPDDINNWDLSRHWVQYYSHVGEMSQLRLLMYRLVAVAFLTFVALWALRISRKQKPA